MSALVSRAVRRGLLRLPAGLRRRVEPRVLSAYQLLLRVGADRADGVVGPRGIPLPPPSLRILASGTPDPDYFLDTGRRHVELIRRLVERHAGSLDEMIAILDFGCGAGRNARWLADLSGPALFGCDRNPDPVRWCRANLAFLNAAVSEPEPPLPYVDASFDFVYALSVFTHLPEKQALAWLAELRRVIRPGGWLLFTTAGTAYRDRLSRSEASRFDRGEEVVQFETAAATNLCIAYHGPAYVRRKMLSGYELVDSFLAAERRDEAERARLPQDVYLVRVPAGR